MTTRQETIALVGVMIPLGIVMVILAATGQVEALKSVAETTALLVLCSYVLRRL